MRQDTFKTIKILDTTLRDGEQAPGFSMNLKEKVLLAKQLERLGVDIIEAGFAASSPGDLKAIQTITKEIKNCTITSLARATASDIDKAWLAVKEAISPRLHIFIATSEIHMRHKLRKTPEQVLEQAIKAVKYAKTFVEDVQFSAEDATRSDIHFLSQIIQRVIEAGATVVNIPDTVGYINPQEFARLLTNIKNNVADIDTVTLAVHCHNDLGLAVANTMAAIECGIGQVECTVNGIGERAGNAALEEVVMGLVTRPDSYRATTNIDTKQIYRTSLLLTNITGSLIQANKAIVGANAFAHEAGIHQHGILANKATYEIMTPASIGLPKNDLILGKHSGRHALEDKLTEMGYSFEEKELSEIFAQFKKLADKKKVIKNQDLLALAEARAIPVQETYSLISFVINGGNCFTPTASVKIASQGSSKEAVAIGQGPIDASFKAIDKTVEIEFSLANLTLNSVTEDKDAQGEALVHLRRGGKVYVGRGLSTDIIEACIKAYLNGINKIVEDI